MKHSELVATAQTLAAAILGDGAAAQVVLLNSPVLSPTNPALRFRFAFSKPGQTAKALITQLATSVNITGSPDSLPVLRAVERAIARGMNAHRPWAELGLGLAHIETSSVAIAADSCWLLFDYRFQPTSYEHES